jgi:DNA-binding transcriptional ArsR family regulator
MRDVSSTAARQLAGLARLLAHQHRAGICLALLDGRAWTASELAAQLAVSPSTASEHISQLVAAGVLAERRQGRHRYLQLAGVEVAELLEGLAARMDHGADRPRSLRTARTKRALARARTCYDHLAGSLGVAITDAMLDRDLLRERGGLALTELGRDWLVARLGADRAQLDATGRPLVRACLDWTERRTHVAGLTGSIIHRRCTELGWLERRRDGRAVSVTATGQAALDDLLGIRWDDLAP